jgi:hypothetical protein
MSTPADATEVDTRQCKGKRTYNKRDDKLVVKQQHTQNGGGGLHCYRCNLCSYWHIGHSTPRTKPGSKYDDPEMVAANDPNNPLRKLANLQEARLQVTEQIANPHFRPSELADLQRKLARIEKKIESLKELV